MTTVICVRFSVGKTGIAAEECKSRINKYLSTYASSWVIVEEEEPDNLHWQGWFCTEKPFKKMDNFRNPFTYAFKDASVKGNALCSFEKMKSTFDDVHRYTMKGRTKGAPVVLVTAQYLEYNDEYVRKWHLENNWYDKEKKALSTVQEHITDMAIKYFRERPWEPFTDVSSKEKEIATWMLRQMRDTGRRWPGDYIFCNYITTVLLQVDKESESYIIDRCLNRLNR